MLPLPHVEVETAPHSGLSRGVKQRANRRRILGSVVNDAIDGVNWHGGCQAAALESPSSIQCACIDELSGVCKSRLEEKRFLFEKPQKLSARFCSPRAWATSLGWALVVWRRLSLVLSVCRMMSATHRCLILC